MWGQSPGKELSEYQIAVYGSTNVWPGVRAPETMSAWLQPKVAETSALKLRRQEKQSPRKGNEWQATAATTYAGLDEDHVGIMLELYFGNVFLNC